MLWLILVDTHSRGSTDGHPGQPTLYKPEYVELAHNDCLLGATNEVSYPPIVIPTRADHIRA